MNWRPAVVSLSLLGGGLLTSATAVIATVPRQAAAPLASQQRVSSTIDPAIMLYEPSSDDGYVSALQTLMPLVDATFGVEAFSTRSHGSQSTGRKIPIAGRTIADILDELGRATPGYTWRDANGVILIAPSAGAGTSFLETAVPAFSVQNQPIGESVRTVARLFDSSVPVTAGSALTVPCPLNRPSQCSSMMQAIIDGGQKRASVSLTNTNVRDILTAVALAHQSHYWLVRHYDDTRDYDNCTIALELGAGASEMFTARRR
jgi:hypothetical protein